MKIWPKGCRCRVIPLCSVERMGIGMGRRRRLGAREAGNDRNTSFDEGMKGTSRNSTRASKQNETT